MLILNLLIIVFFSIIFLMTPLARILLVDDEQDILRLLSYNLKKHGYQTDEVRDGEDALRRVREHSYQLIILDLMLPGLSGMEICSILKRDPKTASIPVIMLTARSEEMDKVSGLESGADDYITKPFGVREFLARVKTVLRRAEGTKAVDGILRGGSIEIDIERHRAQVGDKPLELSPTEFRLLGFLMERRGRVFSRDQILDAVWKGDAFVEQRTVDVHIRRLRAELEKVGAGQYIQTVRGVGYSFTEED
jgi:phosphate regulon transcriptional regulator PhoB